VPTPLLTLAVQQAMQAAQRRGANSVPCSLDLGRSMTSVELGENGWRWHERTYPYLQRCKDRTVYYWTGDAFAPVARFSGALIKLVPTAWGPPTFEIDGIKMLPTAKVSPYVDAQNKVALIAPMGKRVLDTCGGLGYFAACCQESGASEILSCEKNADVIWLRSINPWSPKIGAGLSLHHGDITALITTIATASIDAILHDPPRFGIAGELYSQLFYAELARVLRSGGRLFHYTGSPNKLTTGRDLPGEVITRLQRVGFNAERHGDGVLATRRG
jgi:uncharacterized protein